eukprot:symbB.v1.2.038796.t1/scaffold6109.1/size20858/1
MEATFAADFYMVAGDYNADGSYFDEDTEWTSIMSNIPNYTLLTGNEMDTTLALSSNTYDRIIATSSLEASGAAVYKLEDHVNLSGVFQQGCQDGYINSDVCSASPLEWHEVAKELSDHYPVELCMHLNGTCDSCVAATTTAPVVLSAGSCAVVGFHADNPDDFGLLLLETVPANFVVYVTDRGVLSDGSLRSGEGILQYTSVEDVLPGTVLLLQNFSSSSGTFSLSSSGDQIIAFSGSEASPSFMCGINFEGTSWQSTADSASSSAVPPGLEASMAALALPETDNAAYVGNTTGTAQELLTRIQGTENWQSDNSAAVPIPTSFVLLQDPTTSSSTSGTSTVTSTTTSTSATTSTISTASMSITTTGTSATQSTATSTAFTSTAAATATTATTTTTATTASTSTITETITTATVTTITATGSISSSTSREHGSSSQENLNTTTETMTTSSSLVETSTSTEVWETSTTGEGPMAVAGSRKSLQTSTRTPENKNNEPLTATMEVHHIACPNHMDNDSPGRDWQEAAPGFTSRFGRSDRREALGASRASSPVVMSRNTSRAPSRAPSQAPSRAPSCGPSGAATPEVPPPPPVSPLERLRGALACAKRSGVDDVLLAKADAFLRLQESRKQALQLTISKMGSAFERARLCNDVPCMKQIKEMRPALRVALDEEPSSEVPGTGSVTSFEWISPLEQEAPA